MLRLFVAIPIPQEIKYQLSQLTGGLTGARWVQPENYHITLKFIGQTSNRIADDINEILHDISHDIFDIHLTSFGHFGRRGNASCLIAAIEKKPSLLTFQRKIERNLNTIGLKPEKRKFFPHITLAYLKNISDSHLHQYAQKTYFPRSLTFKAHNFCLFSSYLSPNGAIYTEEARYCLNGGLDEKWTEQVAQEFAIEYKFKYQNLTIPKASIVS